MTSHGRIGDHWGMPPLGSDVRAEVRTWIEATWDPERPLVEWRRQLADSGWAVPSWPVDCYGRGLPAEADAIVAEELTRAGAVGVPVGVGIGLAAPTILSHGSPELKARLLHRIVTGEDMWCQLFSEPGSGSGDHGCLGGRGFASDSRSLIAAMSSTPETPSIAA